MRILSSVFTSLNTTNVPCTHAAELTTLGNVVVEKATIGNFTVDNGVRDQLCSVLHASSLNIIFTYFARCRTVHAVCVHLRESRRGCQGPQGEGQSDSVGPWCVQYSGTLGGRTAGRQTVGRPNPDPQRGRHHGRTINLPRLHVLLVRSALLVRSVVRRLPG